MRLGELLLSEKLVTADGLEEALESQVVHGGRLGTNLVELGLLSEQDLAKALGKQHGVPFASGSMNPDPRAMDLLEIDYQDDRDVLPMRVDQTRISLACINPHDLKTMDEIAFRTGKRVVTVVIPEFRMHQMLRKYCKAFRNIRAIDMDQIRPSRTQTAKLSPQASADLMSEDEFQSLYAQALKGETEAEAQPAPEPAVLEGELLEEEVPEAPAPQLVAPPAPPPPRPAMPTAPPAAQLPPAASAQMGRPAQPSAQIAALQQPSPQVRPQAPGIAAQAPQGPAAQARVPPPPAPPPEPPPTPLSFPEAQQELARSSDREDVAKTVLRFALGKWKRALLLNVQGPLVTGWHGMGEGLREKAIRRIGVALRGQSSFKLVTDTRSHFIGPIRRDAGTAVFYKLLGGDYPTTAVMLPLLVRGKVVHILYVDNGPKEVTQPDIGELLILSQGVARSYEAMIKRRKSA